MLERAWEMQIAIEKWLDDPDTNDRYTKLRLKQEEWNHVDMLLNILKPFSQITAAIGRTTSPTIHEPFRLYNYLFDELEKHEKHYAHPTRRSTQGKGDVATATQAAKDKLSQYYGKTIGKGGTFYALATILTPWIKKTLFQASTCFYPLSSYITFERDMSD
jgi:hypothetical protein